MRRIFQTWKSKTDIPDNMRQWQETAKIANPDYDLVLWDDDDNRNFVKERFPWFLNTYDSFPAEIYRADAIRPLYLFEYGGYYADMDVEFLRGFDHLGPLDGVVLGSMGTNPNFPHSIPNATMGSCEKQEFWLYYARLMMETDPYQRPEYVTGPVVLKKAYDTYTQQYDSNFVQSRLSKIEEKTSQSKVYLLSGEMFFPLNWNDRIHSMFREQVLQKNISHKDALELFPNSLTVTYWSHSWE